MAHKHFSHRMLVAMLAAGCIAAAAPPASAVTESRLIGYRGDLDGDLAVTHADAVLLSDYLLTGTSTLMLPDDAQSFEQWFTARADMNQDGTVNAVDLTLLKRAALGLAAPEGIYEEFEVPDETETTTPAETTTPDETDPPEPDALIPPPVQALNPTLGSVGTTQILMFAVSFPDCAFTEGYTTEQIWEMSFGPEDTSSPAYPLESISAYYERASYGRLHMEGDVYQYTASQSINSYVGDTDRLLEEIMAAMDDQIDYTKYDVNADGTMDTVIVALPGDASDADWWPVSGGYYGRQRFDGVRAGNLCIGSWALSDRAGFNSTWVHELGHAMGLPDYYKYENTQDGFEGLIGEAGWEMMDDAFADMSAFSKLMYGWYTESEVQIYTGGTQTFTLESSQYAPNCLLIPRGTFDSYYSEYFIVEVNTPDQNNLHGFYEDYAYPLFYEAGVRVLHCDAELWDGYWGPELKWNNYGQNYDTSNQKQRVLRLVNEREGGSYMGAGSTVGSEIVGFHWYDDNGDLTVDPGLTITVNAAADGIYTITVAQS